MQVLARTQGGVSCQKSFADCGDCIDPVRTRSCLFGIAESNQSLNLEKHLRCYKLNVDAYGVAEVTVAVAADNLNFAAPGSVDGVTRADIVTLEVWYFVRDNDTLEPAYEKLELPPKRNRKHDAPSVVGSFDDDNDDAAMQNEDTPPTIYGPVQRRTAPESLFGYDGVTVSRLYPKQSNPDVSSRTVRERAAAATADEQDTFKLHVHAERTAFAMYNESARQTNNCAPTSMKSFLRHLHKDQKDTKQVMISAPPIPLDATTPEAVDAIVHRCIQLADKLEIEALMLVVDVGEYVLYSKQRLFIIILNACMQADKSNGGSVSEELLTILIQSFLCLTLMEGTPV